MLIGAYGMFWQRDYVNWRPGPGRPFEMLGTRGQTVPTRRVVDFRWAHGVYVLFNDHGAYYVGLARGKNGFGGRLRQHTADEHAHRWTRFCWFAFDEVTREKDAVGMNVLRVRDKPVQNSGAELIREVEALLITIMNTQNINKMRFVKGESWDQVPHWEREWYISRLLT